MSDNIEATAKQISKEAPEQTKKARAAAEEQAQKIADEAKPTAEKTSKTLEDTVRDVAKSEPLFFFENCAAPNWPCMLRALCHKVSQYLLKQSLAFRRLFTILSCMSLISAGACRMSEQDRQCHIGCCTSYEAVVPH